MIKGAFLLCCGTGFSVWIYFASGLSNHPEFCWVPIILIPFMYAAMFALDLIFLFILSLLMKPLIKKDKEGINRWAYWEIMQTVYVLDFFARVKINVTGLENVPEGECLIVNNHLSNWDQMVLMKVLRKKRFLCITKPENFKFPISGSFIHEAGYIPISRTNSDSAKETVVKCARYVHQYHTSICVSPEGTRSKTHILQPFHPRCFDIAFQAKIPVLVISLQNTYNIKNNFPWHRTPVEVHILACLPYESFKNEQIWDVSNRAHDLIQADLEKRNDDEPEEVIA